MNTQKNTKGFLTMEILIATAIFSAVTSATLLVAFGGQTAGTDVDLGNGGLYQTFSRLETGAASSTGSWGNYTGATTTGSTYNSTTTAIFISPCAQLVSTNSGWTAEQARKLGVDMQTVIVNVASSTELGGNCSAMPPIGWDNPKSFGSADVSGSQGTGVAAHAKNGRTYAMVTGAPSSVAKEDFIVVDATDAANPTVSAKINTGNGLSGVAVGGDYAYVIQNDNTKQLQVIDISNPAAPVLIASSTLPNITFTCSGSTKCLAGTAIAYYAGRVYIGTAYIANLALPATKNNEFHVFCVSDTTVPGCSPTTPVWMGSLNVNHNVNSIAVKGNVAYLATSNDGGELTVVNVANPASMIVDPNMKYDAQTTSGGASDEDGESVYVLGDTAYLGRDRVNGSNERDFYVLNIASTTNIIAISSVKLGIASGTYVSGIIKQGPLAFVVTTDSNTPLFVYDLTDPANPVNNITGTCGLNFSQVTRGIAYISNLLFTVNRSNDLLRVMYDQPTSC